MRIVTASFVLLSLVMSSGCEIQERIQAYDKLQKLKEEHAELKERYAKLEKENDKLREKLAGHKESVRDLYE